MEQINITKLDHQGRGIGKINDKIVFVNKAYPDEIVDIKIIDDKKNYSEAEVVNYIQKSKNRIENICPHFINCGGCTFIDLKYEEQLNYKEEKIKELAVRNQIQTKINPIIKSESQFYYRNKVIFHIRKELGYYKNKTYQIEPIEKCHIVNQKINDALNIIKKEINYHNLKDITIRYSENKDELMLILDGHLLSSEFDTLKQTFSTIIVQKGNKENIIFGDGFIKEKLNKYVFKISPTAFFQVNTKQTEILYNKVLEYIEPKKTDIVLDLYCGTGTIGLYISEYCQKVIGIELNKEAIQDAKENAELNNITNIEFIASDTNYINTITKEIPNKIIVDPPRSGLTNKVIEYLIKTNPEKIVYVSCDPVTLMRDLKLLSEKFNIEEITPVDMFPNTYHVECVILLQRKN